MTAETAGVYFCAVVSLVSGLVELAHIHLSSLFSNALFVMISDLCCCHGTVIIVNT